VTRPGRLRRRARWPWSARNAARAFRQFRYWKPQLPRNGSAGWNGL